MEWTKEEMDDLLTRIQKRSMTDENFRRKLLEDTDAALEEEAGRKLPEGLKLKVIENDPAYSATLVLPDLIMEEFSADDLDQLSGGVSFMLIVSACAAAAATVACAGDACAAKGCIADIVCAGLACAAQGTVAQA